MDELMKRENLPDNPQSEDAYRSIWGYVIEAQGQVYTAVNAAMVTAYWKIGKSIFEACGENDRAAYGKQVPKYISERLTEELNAVGIDVSKGRSTVTIRQPGDVVILSRAWCKILCKRNSTKSRRGAMKSAQAAG